MSTEPGKTRLSSPTSTSASASCSSASHQIMDLGPVDEDHAAALAAAAAAAAADEDLAAGMRFLATPDRPKKSFRNSTATTPTPNFFSYSNDYQNGYRHVFHDDIEAVNDVDGTGLRTPSLLSSPSVASSLGFSTGTGRMSPLRRETSRQSPYQGRSRGFSDASPTSQRTNRLSRRNRDALARRLSQLAHELTSGNDDMDEEGIDMLTAQLDHLEGAVLKKSTTFSTPATPSPRNTPQRAMSVETRSPPDSIFSSPASSVFRTRFSDLSASIIRQKPEPEPVPEPPQKKGMSPAQAKKVIAEAMKLNEELSQLVKNLQARQEESDHIHSLLVERAERAAQRILFLQSRIKHHEQELRDNDDELQHLRILLKAVEIQLPPHPDRELQRCISTFKQDYQALKRKRANRTSTLSTLSSYPGSPSR